MNRLFEWAELMKSHPHFFIFGYFGWYNVGDDAIGLSVITELKRRYPDARFTVTCNDRYFVENFHETDICEGLETIGFGISSISKAIRKSDFFIITGGTHFHDEDGLNFRRVKLLLSFVMLTYYARFSRKSPFLLGHGIGPLSSSWSKKMVKIILKNSNKILVRDGDSASIVTTLGFGEKCVQGFDCSATLIEENSALGRSPQCQDESKRIGISLLPVYGIYANDMEKDDDIVKSFAACLESILMADDSITIRLIAFRTGPRHSDVSLLEKLKENINVRPDAIELIQYDGTVGNFLKSVEECDYCIGMRYHASVFAYLLKKPQLILDYMGKCKSLGQDIAIDERAIIPIEEIITPRFCGAVQAFLSNPSQYIAYLPVHAAVTRTETMFDIMDKEL